MPNTCHINDCDRDVYGHKMCSKHYQRAKRRGELPSSKPCTIDGCNSPQKARTWCGMHWIRWKNHGDVNVDVRDVYFTTAERFDARTRRDPNGCLTWTGAQNGRGYGRMRHDGKYYYPHRWAYEQEHGPIPEGMFIDHICHNRACCEPSHLRLATNKQNLENRKGPQKNNLSSGVRGVALHRSTGKWTVNVGHNSEHFYIGIYPTIEEAELAAIEARNELFTHNTVDRVRVRNIVAEHMGAGRPPVRAADADVPVAA